MPLDNDNETRIVKQLKYILDPKNRNEIDQIRKNGQKFCQENLTVDFMYNKFIDILKD